MDYLSTQYRLYAYQPRDGYTVWGFSDLTIAREAAEALMQENPINGFYLVNADTGRCYRKGGTDCKPLHWTPRHLSKRDLLLRDMGL